MIDLWLPPRNHIGDRRQGRYDVRGSLQGFSNVLRSPV